MVRMSKTVSTLAVLVLFGTAVLYLFQQQLSGAWFTFGVHPEVVELLEHSLEDQKELARSDSEHAAAYRSHFDTIQATVSNLKVLEHNRDAIVNRYEMLLLTLLGGTLLLTAGASVLLARRNETRLQRLQQSLTELSLGHTQVSTGEKSHDTIGRIATMIEQTSRRMTRDRHRLASLRHLAVWQEAARRQGHEMRTPLTAARLQLDRLQTLVASQDTNSAGQLVVKVGEELRRLERFAHQFSSFARLAKPKLAGCDLVDLINEFCELFSNAWPNLELRFQQPGTCVEVMADAPMLRQIFVNLCENSSLALAPNHGIVTFTITSNSDTATVSVADTGSGIDSSIRDRLFEPYATTSQIGHGSGLGLTISRKIMLDHGGDLELAETSPEGTSFSLVLPFFSSEKTNE